MKSFSKRLAEAVTKISVASGATAVGVEIKDSDKVKALLKDYDWYAEMINDLQKQKAAMQHNSKILMDLKSLGVDIISNPKYLDPSGKHGREINLKHINEAADVVKSLADKSGKSVEEVEGLWNKAKASAADEGHVDNYAYITGVLEKMLGLNEEYEDDEPYDVCDSIINVMIFGLQTHFYHVLTKNKGAGSFAQHEALGSFYNDITKDSDSLMEMYLGMGGEISYELYDYEFNMTYDKDLFLEELAEFRESITNAIAMTNEPSLMSLNNTFVDIQEDIDELSYKFTLE